MRKFLLFCLSLCVGTTVGYAQDDEVDHSFEFVTNAGDIIPHGSVYVINSVVSEEDPETIDNGSYMTCALGSCLPGRTEPGYFSSASGTIAPGATSGDLQTEWYPDAYGECDVELQIEMGEDLGFGEFGFSDYGPKITLKFVYSDPVGVKDGISSRPAEIVGRYTLDGQAVNFLTHGVYILRMSDGTTRKVIVK